MTGSTPELSSRLMDVALTAWFMRQGLSMAGRLAAVRRIAPKMFLPIGLAANQMGPPGHELFIYEHWTPRGPIDHTLGAKARQFPSPPLVLVTRSLSSRYLWPLKCSLTVRSPTVSWRHLWDPLRPKFSAKRNQMAEYKQSAS